MTDKHYRRVLKGYFESENSGPSDQEKKLPQPPLTKSYGGENKAIKLTPPLETKLQKSDISTCIEERVSNRKWADEELDLAQLSYLLWATQGVKSIANNGYFTKRTVPSGGSRHPFETYLAINRVKDLSPGVYQYLPLEHAIVLLRKDGDLEEKINKACCGQIFCGKAPVNFCWSAIPYRAEWRYQNYAMKAILLDCGHVCQNLYLACEALGLGTCAIAAYVQDQMDEILELDGEDEFTVYLAPVGIPVFSDSANRIS